MSEKLRTLQELLEYQLKDLHSAEALIIEALPKVISKVRNRGLKKIFELHLEETKGQQYRLEKAADALDVDPSGERCNPMEGYVREITKLIRTEKNKDDLDSGLAAVALKIEEYEVAEYTKAHQYARKLGLHSLAELLSETLDQEKHACRELTQFAEEEIKQELETLEF